MQDQEMKALVRGFVRWLMRVGLALNLIIWVAVAYAFCQTPSPTPKKEIIHATEHTDKIQQEDEIRMMSVVVTEKVGDLVYLYRENNKLIEVTYLFWDKNSVIKDPDAKAPYQFKGCYLMLFCLQHKYIYWLQREKCVPNKGGFFFSDKDP